MSDRHNTLVFLALGLILLAIMAAQVRREDDRSALTHLARAATSPIAGAVSWAGQTVGGVWQRYFALVRVERERAELARRVALLELERTRVAELSRENRRLRSLLELRSSTAQQGALVARVASFLSGGPARRAVLVDRGGRDGVAIGWVALSDGAVIGRVIDVTRATAEVLLIVDPDSGVAVRHQDGRFAGVLRGGNRGPAQLHPLEYVPRDVPVAVGDALVTSGLDRLYPPGLLVGHIRRLDDGSPLTWSIQVEVAFDPSRLEEVLLLPPLELGSASAGDEP